MRAIPLVRTSSVRPFLDCIEQLGAPPGRALSGARALLHDRTALLPVPTAGVLIAEASDAAGDEAFGLRAGAATRILEFGDWGAVLRNARTLGGFVATIGAAARRFNTGQQFWAEQRGDEVRLHWQYTTRLVQGRRVAADFALVMVLQALRLAAGPSWRPDEIHLEGASPRYAPELEALAGKRICFEQPCWALVFPARVLSARFPLLPLGRPQQAAHAPAEDFEGSIRQLVDALLKLGAPDLPVAAEAVRMSERSLQRRLAECGLSFARVVEDARFDTACRMLGDPALKIVEISAELGYTDSANFTRAFRRWSGLSPQAFRRTG